MSGSTGTLLWIGPRDTAETAPAFGYCQRQASQLALRDDFADAAARRADAVTTIVAVRAWRAAVPSGDLKRVESRYPDARRIQLVGSQCEGEARTGHPWPDWQRLRWHAWNQVMPGWFEDRADPDRLDAVPLDGHVGWGVTMIVAASRQAAAPLLDLLTANSATGLWTPPARVGMATNVQRVIWDDSAAPSTSAAHWRERLGTVATAPGARHAWTMNYPRAAELAAAREGGVDAMFSKPYLRQPWLHFLSNESIAS